MPIKTMNTHYQQDQEYLDYINGLNANQLTFHRYMVNAYVGEAYVPSKWTTGPTSLLGIVLYDPDTLHMLPTLCENGLELFKVTGYMSIDELDGSNEQAAMDEENVLPDWRYEDNDDEMEHVLYGSVYFTSKHLHIRGIVLLQARVRQRTTQIRVIRSLHETGKV